MFTLFKYLVWLVVALLCLMLATISISEFLVESAIDAPYDEKLTDYVRVLSTAVEADGNGLRVRQAGVQVLRSDRLDRIFYSVRDPLILEVLDVMRRYFYAQLAEGQAMLDEIKSEGVAHG